MSTPTVNDILSRRIAEITQPAKAADALPAKKAPLTWEDEELAYYEPRRTVAAAEKRRADAKAELLTRQLPHQWNALREVISLRCESLNAKAGRTILHSVDPDRNRLEIRREDDEGFVMRFNPENKRVIFTGKPLGFDREYELTVQTRNEVDSTAWFSLSTLATEQTDDLAKYMVSILLRFDQ
jgi:hypothetical protein